jgi:outer membrane protein, multidrug efflux system
MSLAAATLMAGCTVGPNYVKPDIPVEKGWDAAKAEGPANGAELSRWWQTFKDPELDRLVTEALKSNLDLKLAGARVRDARAQLLVARSAGLPFLNASASDTWGGNSANIITKSSFGTVHSTGATTSLYRAGFDAGWEIDVFGGIRRSVEAAEAGIDASVEDLRSVQVTLLGEVAGLYIDLRGQQSLLAIAKDNLKSQQDTLELTKARYKGGLSSGLDVAEAEAQAADTASQIPTIETAIKRDIYGLSVLLGQDPSALVGELGTVSPVPAGSGEALPGLPSELLLRRPDVRGAERRLASATAEIGVATADLYPRFDLTALLALESSHLSSLFQRESGAWQIVPGVSVPLFAGGRLNANVESKNAQQEQALLIYRQTILSALQEVENSLVAFYKSQERLTFLVKEVEQNKLAVELANERYTKGLTGFVDVLTAERSLYASQSSLSLSQTAVSTNLVSLYKALGGGWEMPVEQAKKE